MRINIRIEGSKILRFSILLFFNLPNNNDYHGQSCIKGDTQHKPLYPHRKTKADQLYKATLHLENNIQSLGFDYISIWECDF